MYIALFAVFSFIPFSPLKAIFFFFKNLIIHFLFLQILVLGQPGEEVSLELVLRVVADVGLVVCYTYPKIFIFNQTTS